MSYHWKGEHRKRPLVERGLYAATIDRDQIRNWWRRWPKALIGLPTGRTSDTVVLDIDVKRADTNGLDTLAELGCAILPDTPLVHTASGGLHLYFLEQSDDLPRKAHVKCALPPAAKIALDVLQRAIAEAGKDAPASNHIPRRPVVEVETWRRYYYAGTASDGETPEARRKSFQRAREKLQAAGIIGIHADLVWIVDDARS